MKRLLWLIPLAILGPALMAADTGRYDVTVIWEATCADIVLVDGDLVQCVQMVAVGSPTPTPPTATPPPPTPTATLPPPTATSPPPTATATAPPPTPTATPAGSIDPFPEAPLCPSHDPTAWHSLWDSARGCHYNHTHNANPADADGVFGPVLAGQTISYPWQTPDENALKHEGYKYAVMLALPAGRTDTNFAPGVNNQVTDIRVQYHNVGGALGAVTRFHSFYAEARVCSKDNLADCGLARWGGHNDFGILHVPYKVLHIPLPSDPNPITQSLHEDPYRAHRTLQEGRDLGAASWANCRTCWNNPATPNDIRHLWTTQPGRYGYNLVGGFSYSIFDEWQGVSQSDPFLVEQVCGTACRFNSSEHQLANTWLWVDPALDGSQFDTDPAVGFVSYTGFTTVQGGISTACTAPGPDCVPLVWQHVPVGYGVWKNPSNNQKWLERYQDFDLSPAPAWWIEYPN